MFVHNWSWGLYFIIMFHLGLGFYTALVKGLGFIKCISFKLSLVLVEMYFDVHTV
jgi:hypothetical protein